MVYNFLHYVIFVFLIARRVFRIGRFLLVGGGDYVGSRGVFGVTLGVIYVVVWFWDGECGGRGGGERNSFLTGVVTVSGRGKNIKGAAASIGLTTYLKGVNGGALLISTSPRKGTADNITVSGDGIGFSACSVLISNTGTRRYILAAPCSGLRVLPSDLSLTTTRLRVTRGPRERTLLGGTLLPVGRCCSCVVVSYPPSLKLVATGTLAITSAFLIPVRYRCCTLRKLSRLVGAMEEVGERCGRSVRVRNILLAVCSKQLGLARRMMSRIGGFFPQGIFGAIIPEKMELSRTPDFNVPIVCCSGSYGNDRTCATLTRRVIKGREN